MGERARKPWPVTLAHGAVKLRPATLRDRSAWRAVRLRNEAWLSPWEPTAEGDWRARHSSLSYLRMRRDSRIAARERHVMPFVIEYAGALVGQLSLGPVHWGPVRSSEIGYWVDRARAGQGIAPVAVALAVRHAFDSGLHRVQAAIAPENAASIRVAEKVGMRQEGLLRGYLHIGGAWRDHICFALTADDDLGPLGACLR